MGPALPLLAIAAIGTYFLTRPKPVAPVPTPSGGTAVVPQPATPPGTPVLPVPGGGGTSVLPAVTPANVAQTYRTMSISELVAATNDPMTRALTDDTPNTVDLMPGENIVLVVTQQPLAPALNWVAVPATITATSPSATATVTAQIPDGPPPGTAFELGATDAFFDPQAQALPGYLQNHGQSPVPGLAYA